MHTLARLFIGIGALWSAAASAQSDATLADVVICATAADARNYATTHQDAIQRAIQAELTGKACVVGKIAFVPGKQSDRIEQKDATYVVTEITVVGVSTPLGVLGLRPSLAFTLLRSRGERASDGIGTDRAPS